MCSWTLALHVLQRRNAGVLVLGDLQDDEALVGADGLGVFAGLHGEHLLLQFLGEGAALEVFQVATRGRSRAVGILLGQVVELAALLQQGVNLVGFGLRPWQRRRDWRLRAALLSLFPS